jgi:3-oxoacyl-[acyl-carrier protein] reductase
MSVRTALVTGGSRGIGRAVSLKLADDGFDIAINYAGNEHAAQETVRLIEAKGRKAIAVKGDVGDAQTVEALFAEAGRALGVPDAVVSNAGILTMQAIADMPVQVAQNILMTNVMGTFHVMQHAARTMAKGGRIVTLSTSVVAMNLPNYGAYTASKAAVEALTRTLANELRGREITVNAVAPGPTATDLFFEGKSPETLERLTKMPPLERLGTPEDIANVVAFLCSPEAGWINGQIVRANGGLA